LNFFLQSSHLSSEKKEGSSDHFLKKAFERKKSICLPTIRDTKKGIFWKWPFFPFGPIKE
jgi:hypothetical protein